MFCRYRMATPPPPALLPRQDMETSRHIMLNKCWKVPSTEDRCYIDLPIFNISFSNLTTRLCKCFSPGRSSFHLHGVCCNIGARLALYPRCRILFSFYYPLYLCMQKLMRLQKRIQEWENVRISSLLLVFLIRITNE